MNCRIYLSMHTLMDMLFLVKSRQQIDGFSWILQNLVSFAIIKKKSNIHSPPPSSHQIASILSKQIYFYFYFYFFGD